MRAYSWPEGRKTDNTHSIKSPLVPVHKTKVTMQRRRMTAIQIFWYLRKLVNGLKAMGSLRLGRHVRRPPPGGRLDKPRHHGVRLMRTPKIAIVAKLRDGSRGSRRLA